MEWLAALFVVGSALFWVEIAIIAVVVGICVASESYFWASTVVVLGLVALGWFSGVNIVLLAWAHPLTALWCVLGYVALGVGWAFWKWIVYSRDELKRFLKQKATIQSNYDSASETSKAGRTFAQYVKYRYDYPPEAKKHKTKITEWIMFWPFSLVITFLGDYITRFFRWVYTKLVTTFDRLTAWIWKDSGLV